MMKRFNLLLASGLLVLPVAAWAQGATDGKAVTQPSTVGQSGVAAPSSTGGQAVAGSQTGSMGTQSGTVAPTAPATSGVKTGTADKAAGASKAEPAGKTAVKPDGLVKTHAGVKTTPADHAHTTMQTNGQAKQPEAPKS